MLSFLQVPQHDDPRPPWGYLWGAVGGLAVLILILTLGLSACVATQDFVETRDQQSSALDAERIQGAAKLTQETLEGKRDPAKLESSIEKMLEGKPLPEPTEDQLEVPWGEITTGLTTLVLAYFGINAKRNSDRRKRKEPITPEEAEQQNAVWEAEIADSGNHYRRPVEPMPTS